MPEQTDIPALPLTQPLRLAEFNARKPVIFEIAPDADLRAAIAGYLGAQALRKLRFNGTLRPEGKHDWRLEGDLGATLVQGCVVTLQPVTTRVDETVRRQYLAEWDPEEQEEAEIPEDETLEPLGAVIDPAAVMIEALALAMPLYPRAEGADLGEAVHAEPGVTPMRDADARPFAGLRDRLARDED